MSSAESLSTASLAARYESARPDHRLFTPCHLARQTSSTTVWNCTKSSVCSSSIVSKHHWLLWIYNLSWSLNAKERLLFRWINILKVVSTKLTEDGSYSNILVTLGTTSLFRIGKSALTTELCTKTYCISTLLTILTVIDCIHGYPYLIVSLLFHLLNNN